MTIASSVPGTASAKPTSEWFQPLARVTPVFKSVCGLLLAVGLISHLCPTASNPAPARAQVNIKVQDINDYPAADLQALTAALQQHPQAVTFRVSGRLSGGMFPKRDAFTEFYDRRTRTLRKYSYFFMFQAPKPSIVYWQKTDVTEARIARASSEASATPWDVGTAWNELLTRSGRYSGNIPLDRTPLRDRLPPGFVPPPGNVTLQTGGSPK